MNLKLKVVVLILLTINLVVVIYELVRIFYTSVPTYLSSYDLTEIKKRHLKNVLINLLRSVFSFIIVYLADFKVRENKNDMRNTVVLNIEENQNDKKKLNFAKFFESNKALIVFYLTFLVFSSFKFEVLINTYVPIALYFILYYQYIYNPYSKWLLWNLVGVSIYAFANYIPGANYDSIKVDLKILPLPIYEYIENNFEKYKFVRNDIPDMCTVSMKKNEKSVTIEINGRLLNIATEEEFTSLLYHAIGHIEYKHNTMQEYFTVTIILILILYDIFELVYAKKLRSTDNSDKNAKTLICFYMVFVISIIPYLIMGYNVLTYYQALSADNYSAGIFNKSSLKSILIKKELCSNNYYDLSLLYNFFYSEEPCLVKRISNIKN